MTGSIAGRLIGNIFDRFTEIFAGSRVPQSLEPIEGQALNVGAKAPTPGAKHFFSSLLSCALMGGLTGNWTGGVTGMQYSVELEAC